MQSYLPLILTIFGSAIILFIIISYFQDRQFKKTALKADGVIFRIDEKLSIRFGSSHNRPRRQEITVRFVTQEKEWITENYNPEFIVSFPNQYKEGEKVQIMYDAADPTNFLIVNKTSDIIVRIVAFFLGLSTLTQGILLLMK